MTVEKYLKTWTDEEERMGLVQLSIGEPNPEYVKPLVRKMIIETDMTSSQMVGELVKEYGGAVNPKKLLDIIEYVVDNWAKEVALSNF